MVTEIIMARGSIVTIDDIDSDLASMKWSLGIRGSKTSTIHYTTGHWKKTIGKSSTVYMHRIILSRVVRRPLKRQECVDHINHNGLDNRRCNLRLVTQSQNMCNMRITPRSKSSCFKGVHWFGRTNKWQAQIMMDGKRVHLGYFVDEVDAARAYDEAAKKLHGHNCWLNLLPHNTPDGDQKSRQEEL